MSTPSCPSCATELVTLRGATPWCPACTWNLGLYEPQRRRPEFGWQFVDRLTHRIAYRLTRRAFDRLSGVPLDTVGASGTRIVLLAASTVLLLAVAACAGLGTWLICFDFPQLTIIPGLVLLLAAVLMRPRLGRLSDDVTVLDRAAAPALFGLVDRVAAAIGVRTPDVVGVDYAFNAYTMTVGFRRRRVAVLGLRLVAAVSPQQLVAILSHEMGHFANGDLRRGLLTQMAFRTLGEAADVMRPGVGNQGLGGLLIGVVQWLLSRLLFALHLLLVWLGLRDGQRAEYLADDLAARAAGTAAMIESLDLLLAADGVTTVLRRAMRLTGDVGAWRAVAQDAYASRADRVAVARQLSMRDDASLFASHPPLGLRASMLAGRTATAAQVVLDPADAARIDAELAVRYTRLRRDAELI